MKKFKKGQNKIKKDKVEENDIDIGKMDTNKIKKSNYFVECK